MKKLINCNVKVLAASIIILGSSQVSAQEQVEVSIGSDFVSNYIWRGQDCGGVSIQPTLAVAKSGFSLTAWGSVGFSKSDVREINLVAGYSTGGFSIAVTDYWFDTPDNPRFFEYAAHDTEHIFEGTVGYDFGVVALNWNTYFAGSDYTKQNGKRAYSSYAEISAPFRLGEFDFSAELGITPWEGAYSTGFNVVNIGVGASKEIKFTDSFSLPAFAKLIVNPNTEKTYVVFGVSL